MKDERSVIGCFRGTKVLESIEMIETQGEKFGSSGNRVGAGKPTLTESVKALRASSTTLRPFG